MKVDLIWIDRCLESLPVWARTDPTSLSFMPHIDINLCSALFRAWGFDENLIERLTVVVELDAYLEIEHQTGEHGGELNGIHYIKVNPNLLKQKRYSKFNEAMIHELRHVYWNIINPADHVNEFTGRRYRTYQGIFSDEEQDCYKVERIYRKFKLMRYPNLLSSLILKVRVLLPKLIFST